jgi:hypothetical protein
VQTALAIQFEENSREKSTLEDDDEGRNVADGVVKKEQKTLQSVGSEDEERVRKQLTILRGGFLQIFDMLEKATQQVQINLMHTVHKMLQIDEKHKTEFKKLNGYSLLERLFHAQSDFSDESAEAFTNSIFDILELMLLQGDQEIALISNYDAFALLMRLITHSPVFEIVYKALECLERLVAVNWRNVVVARRLKVHQALVQLCAQL